MISSSACVPNHSGWNRSLTRINTDWGTDKYEGSRACFRGRVAVVWISLPRIGWWRIMDGTIWCLRTSRRACLVTGHHFLIIRSRMMFEEITASSLVRVDLNGRIVMDSGYRASIPRDSRFIARCMRARGCALRDAPSY